MPLEDGNQNRGVDLRSLIAALKATGEGGRAFDAESDETNVAAIIEAIKTGLQPTNPEVVPCKIPSFPSENGFYLFCVRITEDDWLKEHALIVSFSDRTGGRVIAFILKSDREFFNSPEGWRHLRSVNLRFYTVEEYVNLILDNLYRERGVNE